MIARSAVWLVLALVVPGAQAPPPVTMVNAANPHLTMRALVEPEEVTRASEVTLTFEIIPARRVHIYAPGAEYRVVQVTLDPQPGVKAKPLVYPPSDIYHFKPLDERVPVYSKPFVLKQVVALTPRAIKGKERLSLSGRLEYQACDDTVCFRPTAVPFKFDVPVKIAR